jgi:hypothetical protein
MGGGFKEGRLMMHLKCVVLFVAALAICGCAAQKRSVANVPAEKVCGVYTSIPAFAGQESIDAAIKAQPTFLKDKHKKAMAVSTAAANVDLARKAGFNTLFMTIYPLWGTDWWARPEARNLVKDAMVTGHEHFKVHIGLSLFNAQMCEVPEKYPGASRTIQCDGTRPSWVCYFDDALWDYFIKNAVELAKVGKEVPGGGIEGLFVDPEAYGPELYLCFCHNCIEKFNRYSGEKMPVDLVKPDGWLLERGLWEKYTKDWHDQEVRRHAMALRDAVRAVNPDLQLSSLLWDYPVAVGIGDPRQAYFRELAMALGTKEKPAWVLPEHTYYSDGKDLERIVGRVEKDIEEAGASGRLEVLPGIRILRRSAEALRERGDVIKRTDVPGYWMYELSDLGEKGVIDFEGAPVDPAGDYVRVLGEVNGGIRGEAKGR